MRRHRLFRRGPMLGASVGGNLPGTNETGEAAADGPALTALCRSPALQRCPRLVLVCSSRPSSAVEQQGGMHALGQETSAAAMQVFLDRFAANLAPGVHAALLLDQAGWHVAKAIAVPANVSLVHLPPYSPELNPVERVWTWDR